MVSPSQNTALTDQATIDANRYGQLTPYQRQRLKPPSLAGPLFGLALAGALVIPLGWLLLFVARAAFAPAGDSPFAVPTLLGATLTFLALEMPLLLTSLFGLFHRLGLRRDLAEGYIAQADGQVIFSSGAGYHARIFGQTLADLGGDKTLTLPPGAYRFYYLPRSRRMLSAERQMLFEPGGPQAGVREALARANGFRMDELDTNRQGGLSAHQRFGLVRGLLFLAVVLVALVVGAVWQFALLMRYNPWGFLLLGLMLFGLLLATYHRWLDLLEGRAAMLEGFVQATEHSSDDSSTYSYELGKERFTVSSAAYRALIAGERYRLYYLPHSKRLLSIEPVP
ncbi:MAG TPA: hypothetical protein VKT82_11580 [Ktedonobacterales bacterium]|nr:hypothetical protein [Ktedonobacterales bacterium]